jgi:hypothetical protein
MCFESRGPALLVALACGAMTIVASGVALRASGRSGPGTATVSTNAPLQAGVRVSGTIASPDGHPLVSGVVILAPSGNAEPGSVPVGDALIFPDGSFIFKDVPPGIYQIRARAQARGDLFLFAAYGVSVSNRDLSGVRLTLLPGATISGKLDVEATRAPRPRTLAGVRVRSPFADGSSFGDALTGESARDGSFTIRGVMAGRHVITLEGLPDPWVLKAITYRGRDITDEGLETDSAQTFREVRIAITDVATEVSGVVRDDAGTVAPDATVLLIPVAKQFQMRYNRRCGRATTDASGHYRYRGLPAGDYRVAAAVGLDERDAYRSDVLRQLSEAGVPVTLAGAGSRAIDLRLTPVTPASRTASR